MVFENRDNFLIRENEEGRITDSELEDILNLNDRIPEPTKTVLGYLTDVAAMLREQKLADQYVVFGGYGVLCHLVSCFDDNIISVWRGSDDIDMVGSVHVLNSIRSGYNVFNDKPSPNIESKRTLKITPRRQNITSCKIDYVEDDKIVQQDTETVKVMGIPIHVVSPLYIIKNKLGIYDQEAKHCQDIKTLLGVCEYRKIDLTELVKYFSRDERARLYSFLVTQNYFQPDGSRLEFGPTDRYVTALKTVLKKS